MAQIIVQGLEEAIAAVQTKFDQLSAEIRGKKVRALLSSAGRIVRNQARITVPQPGYIGDKPVFKPLRDTIAVKTKEYDRAAVAIIGPRWPAGAHGYNVEFGHRIRVGSRRASRTTSFGGRTGRSVFFPGSTGRLSSQFGFGGRTRPVYYMRRAWKQTEFQVRQKMKTGMKAFVQREWRKLKRQQAA